MSDDQQTPQPEQPAAAQYPGFPISAEGLRRLHEQYGRLMHLSIEQGVGRDELISETQRISAATRAFTAKHTGAGCQPDESANGRADPSQLHDVIGVPPEAITVIPSDKAGARGRARGG